MVEKFSKAILTKGNARFYHKFLVKELYRNQLAVKDSLKKSTRVKKMTDVELDDFCMMDGKEKERSVLETCYMEHKRNFIFYTFNKYVKLTRPIVAYFIKKNKVFKKKKKVYKVTYHMRIAKSFNRDNKLFKQIKSIYFSGRRKKEFGNLNYSTDKFIKEEILRCSKSRIIRSRDRFFKKKGESELKDMLYKHMYG